jgi:Ca2+-binding EF-hand superfamily protein
MDRLKFRDVLHNSFDMTDDILMDRVFRAFDRDNDSYLSMSEWVESLSIFLRGTQEEKIKCRSKCNSYIKEIHLFQLVVFFQN